MCAGGRVAANLQLTDAEGKAFWPVYEAYQKELQQLNQRMTAVIESYASAYNKGPIANDVAKKLLDEAVAIDDAEAKSKGSGRTPNTSLEATAYRTSTRAFDVSAGCACDASPTESGVCESRPK